MRSTRSCGATQGARVPDRHACAARDRCDQCAGPPGRHCQGAGVAGAREHRHHHPHLRSPQDPAGGQSDVQGGFLGRLLQMRAIAGMAVGSNEGLGLRCLACQPHGQTPSARATNGPKTSNADKSLVALSAASPRSWPPRATCLARKASTRFAVTRGRQPHSTHVSAPATLQPPQERHDQAWVSIVVVVVLYRRPCQMRSRSRHSAPVRRGGLRRGLPTSAPS